MLFNTLEFAIFFLAVVLLYQRLKHTAQNRMLLFASYFFYGWWDVRFLSLILLSTILDYLCGLKIHDATRRSSRLRILWISVIGNLSILGFFKYWNFFAHSLQAALSSVGLSIDPFLLRIILPVGISFYTFQTMSYTIDIYRRKMEPTRKFFDFALFVAFFPQLVAGPIERARNLLPQILKPRQVTLTRVGEGMFLIYWGLFEKVFVADNLARIVNATFHQGSANSAPEVLIALYAFAFQIFCDFDGYSNIARGAARCLGFDIMTNFNLPYFSANPAEFWRRWHISLSSWLRDYLYIPLGGNRKGTARTIRNIMITLLLGGLWHGAAWPFILWGAYHGMLIIAYRLFERADPARERFAETGIGYGLRVIFFFHLVCFGWLLFRAPSIADAYGLTQALLFSWRLEDFSVVWPMAGSVLSFIWILLVVQIMQFRAKNLLVVLQWPFLIQWCFYTVLFHTLVMFGASAGQQFIYFRF